MIRASTRTVGERGGAGVSIPRREHRGRGAPPGAAPRPAERVNIAINKHIMTCEDVGDLCSLIQNRVAELNNVT